MPKKEIKEYLAKIGKKGGKTTRKRGPEYYRKIGCKGAEKRWGKKKKEEL